MLQEQESMIKWEHTAKVPNMMQKRNETFCKDTSSNWKMKLANIKGNEIVI